ncbi:MAG: dephospho-CoA kinase [Emergencia sp.]
MTVIGLTGGIGTGKSTVTDYLLKKGFPVIDADEISRKITEKGSPVLQTVREKFGDEYFNSDGSMDRKKMAGLVFNSPSHKALLEGIITSEVLRRVEKEIDLLKETNETDLVFLDAPLLYESGADRMTDSVWVITADEEIRIQRVMKRDNCTRDEVMERIRNQMSCGEKAELAQELIDNSKGREELYLQIEELLIKYADR